MSLSFDSQCSFGARPCARALTWLGLLGALGSWFVSPMLAADESVLKELQAQNALLREQIRAQQSQLDALQAKVEQLAKSDHETEEKLRDLKDKAPARSGSERKINLSGVGSFSYFSGESKGRYPNAEFMLDEARVTLEAQLLKNAYFLGELVLVNREALDENFHLGEYYVDFENAFGAAAPDRLFNVRAGRLWIPFGEEYQVRGPLDNALITHSVTDFWGVDEGIELYGEKGPFTYAFAVQNAGISRLRDFNADKSLTLRLGWAPTEQLRLSASGFRSGRIDQNHDTWSEMWIGNNVFRSNADSTTATRYEVDMVQLDARYDWKSGSASGAVGQGWFNDDERLADHDQKFDFFQVEARQTISGPFYLASRFSRLEFDRGHYLAGLAPLGSYFLSPVKTRRLQRWSVGAGYRFSDDLNLKLEYAFENNVRADGQKRPDEDQLAAQVALRF